MKITINRRELIEALRDEQERRCAYGTREGDGKTCDCKYDVWGKRARTSEMTGCPELRGAILALCRRPGDVLTWVHDQET